MQTSALFDVKKLCAKFMVCPSAWTSGEGVGPVRTFFGQGGRFLSESTKRPYFLVIIAGSYSGKFENIRANQKMNSFFLFSRDQTNPYHTNPMREKRVKF